MKRKHIMIDIETLAKADNAVILSIGAACFDEEKTHEEFYVELPAPEQIDIGRVVDASTVKWWLNQKGKNPTMDIPICDEGYLKGVFEDFWHFINRHSDIEVLETYIWAHGVTFDIVKLQSLMSDIGMKRLDLANKLGCTANAVRKWEYGHMVISKIVQKAIMGMVKG